MPRKTGRNRPVFLEGKRVYLRPLEPGDIEPFYRWFNNPGLRRYLLITTPITKMAQKRFIEKSKARPNPFVLSIIVKKSDRLIGNVSLNKIDRIYRSAELGVAIADLSMVSKGYGTEAISLMLDYGFGTQNLHRIDLAAHDFNKRAINTYKKLGFVIEGIKRDSVFIEGRYHDSVMMAILSNEWKPKRPS